MGYVFFMAHVVFIWGVKLSNWKDPEDIDNCILCRPESMEKGFFSYKPKNLATFCYRIIVLTL